MLGGDFEEVMKNPKSPDPKPTEVKQPKKPRKVFQIFKGIFDDEDI